MFMLNENLTPPPLKKKEEFFIYTYPHVVPIFILFSVEHKIRFFFFFLYPYSKKSVGSTVLLFWTPLTIIIWTFFKISCFVFCRRKQAVHVCNIVCFAKS